MPVAVLERMRRTRAGWPWLTGGWLVLALVLFAWLDATPVPRLREQLKSLQFWSLEACAVLAIALGCAIAPAVRRVLTRRDGLRLLLLASVALWLTLGVAPRTHRIYYDEQIYEGIGQNLSDLRLAQMCNDGTVEYGRLQCWSAEYNKQPYAYPHLLSLAYRVFGVHEGIAFALNAAAMALAVCAVYLLVVLLFDDRVAAFFAGLLLALTPQQIAWSATAAAEPSAALACSVAAICAVHFSRSRRTIALAATAVASAYAAQFRPESFLILPILAMLAAPSRDDLKRAAFWWVALLGAALLVVHAGHLVAVRNEGWGTTDQRLSLRYLPANLGVNLRFYVADWRFPGAFGVLAVLGAVGGARLKARLIVAAWFVAFCGIFLLFYAGSYDYGADVRYSVMTYPPLAVLGGLGAARLVAWTADRFGPGVRPQAMLAGAIVFVFLWYLPLVRATTEEAWAARADVRFAQSMMPRLRGNTYVLTHNPGMFHVAGVNAGQMSRIVADPGFLSALALRYPGGVYLHWNFWCNVQDVVQQEFCQHALDAGRFESFREYRERDQRLAFYRLAAPAGPR